jgi:hypothetical protein
MINPIIKKCELKESYFIIFHKIKKIFPSWVLEAHAFNPSYSGGRDQEDQGSKSAWQIVRKTLS